MLFIPHPLALSSTPYRCGACLFTYLIYYLRVVWVIDSNPLYFKEATLPWATVHATVENPQIVATLARYTNARKQVEGLDAKRNFEGKTRSKDKDFSKARCEFVQRYVATCLLVETLC